MKPETTEVIHASGTTIAVVVAGWLFFASGKPLTAVFLLLVLVLIAVMVLTSVLIKLFSQRPSEVTNVTNERPTHWLTERDYPQEARQEAAADRAAPGAGQG